LPDETINYVVKISRRIDFPTSIKTLARHDMAHDDVDAALFVASSSNTFALKNAAALRSSGYVFNSHHIADLTALTAHADGMFVTLSSK
jgi:hypothetical protein